METLWQDIRYGFRTLRKSPGFTAVAVITLALGIGANTAIFSVVDAVVLRTLPVRDPSQLVYAELRHADGREADGFPVPLFQELHRQNDAVAGLIAFDGGVFDASVDGKPEMLAGHFVSGDFYSVLDVPASVGRTLTPEDDLLSDKPPAAVISYEYWRRRFSLDPAVVGKTIYLNRVPFTIVGVTPRGFLGVPAEKSSVISIPMVMHSRLALKDHTTLGVAARLKAGIPESQASARLTELVQRIAREQNLPDVSSSDRRDLLTQRIDFTPAGRGGLREFSLHLRILMAVVCVLLLIACVNLANLLLVRSTVRRREIATRLAVGASRSRVVRQLLTESLLLATFGGVLGLFLSSWTVDVLPALLSYDDVVVGIDLRVFAFTAAATIAAGVLFGIAPALRSTRVDLVSALKQIPGGGRGAHAGRLGRVLVVAQVSLSFVLLMAAGLFLRTLAKLSSVDPGFSRQHILLASMYPTLLGYQGEKELNLYESVLQQVRAMPGVQAASVSRFRMLGGYWGMDVSSQGNGVRTPETTEVSGNVVASDFFRTMGIPLLLGHDFTSAEEAKSSKVAIVSESFARRFFAGQNAIGQTFHFQNQEGLFTIVGVVKDARSSSLRGNEPGRSTLAAYLPLADAPQELLGQATLEIRATGDPASLTAAVRQRMQSVDKDLTFRTVETQASVVDESLGTERALAELTSGFGVVALLLAGIGLFGLTAYSVGQRTREIGIRMALGAQRMSILDLVVRETMLLTLAGLGIGLVLALVAGRFIATQLFGIAPSDAVTISCTLALKVGVAVAASLAPAHRATKVDPMVALRYE